MRFNDKQWPYAVVAGVSGVVFAFFQAIPQFYDPDSFYHTRLADVMWHSGFITAFPWLQYTTLAQSFTDHHLLYHLLLGPFMALTSPVVGVKVFQALSIVTLAVLLFHQLRRWRLPYTLPAMLALLSVAPFLVRLQLVKASVVAIILFLLVLMSLIERRYMMATIVTVIYTWAHGGFVLAGVAAGMVWLADAIMIMYEQRRWRWPSFRPLIVVASALIVGVVTNPYFPNNLIFFWQQVVQIAIVNYHDTIAVGAEWYPIPVPDFVGVLSLMLIGVVSAMTIMISHRSRYLRDRTAISLTLMTLFFMIAALRSRRHLEYLTPVAWLWSCYIVLPYLVSAQWKKMRQLLRQQWGRVYTVIVVYFLITIPLGTSIAVARTYGTLTDGFPLTTFQGASRYLQQQAPAGAIVFHGSWDEFPMLWFHNIQQRYIVGLDATFMYLFDRDQYQRWVDISAGKSKQQTAHDIVRWFDARYVVIDRHTERTKLLQAYLLRDPQVEVAYEDQQNIVFRIEL